MATIFDILNSINNNNKYNNHYYSPTCKKPNSTNYRESKSIDIIPTIDVTMTDENIIIETELAGVSKDNIDINIKESILTIQGEKKKNTHNHQQQPKLSEKSNCIKDEPSIEEYEDDDNNQITETTKEKSSFSKGENKRYLSERSFGYFKKCLDLTTVLYQLDLSTIKTKFENGLLTITINKKLDHSNPLKINII
ncbi:hypothetical protein RB653_002288 [Dictyostelium firmibasis]|uniref:SHSP domain-containing protein n=1 Tax=Dictyostelium firmibasis TaxID=79012 RepID=A0AAN7TW61_9MYCE